MMNLHLNDLVNVGSALAGLKPYLSGILGTGLALGDGDISTLAMKIIPWGQVLAACGLGYKAWEEFNGTGSLADKIKAALPYLGALILAFAAGQIAMGYLG